MIDDRRGVLFPDRMPRLHRLAPPPAAAELVSWFWIPEWNLPHGESSRQDVVAYPALNLVVTESTVELAGPTTAATYRDLAGRGWAVGALLRPAGAAVLTDSPASLRDRVATLDEPALSAAVTTAMIGDDERRPARAAAAVAAWLVDGASPITDAARRANAMSDLLLSDPGIRTAEQAAARLAVSTRTLQRMAHRYVGLPPLAMIRRRRLQEAAQRLRERPATDLSALAAELGYADHAHLTADFSAVLGMPPSGYRTRL